MWHAFLSVSMMTEADQEVYNYIVFLSITVLFIFERAYSLYPSCLGHSALFMLERDCTILSPKLNDY